MFSQIGFNKKACVTLGLLDLSISISMFLHDCDALKLVISHSIFVCQFVAYNLKHGLLWASKSEVSGLLNKRNHAGTVRDCTRAGTEGCSGWQLRECLKTRRHICVSNSFLRLDLIECNCVIFVQLYCRNENFRHFSKKFLSQYLINMIKGIEMDRLNPFIQVRNSLRLESLAY